MVVPHLVLSKIPEEYCWKTSLSASIAMEMGLWATAALV